MKTELHPKKSKKRKELSDQLENKMWKWGLCRLCTFVLFVSFVASPFGQFHSLHILTQNAFKLLAYGLNLPSLGSVCFFFNFFFSKIIFHPTELGKECSEISLKEETTKCADVRCWHTVDFSTIQITSIIKKMSWFRTQICNQIRLHINGWYIWILS